MSRPLTAARRLRSASTRSAAGQRIRARQEPRRARGRRCRRPACVRWTRGFRGAARHASAGRCRRSSGARCRSRRAPARTTPAATATMRCSRDDRRCQASRITARYACACRRASSPSAWGGPRPRGGDRRRPRSPDRPCRVERPRVGGEGRRLERAGRQESERRRRAREERQRVGGRGRGRHDGGRPHDGPQAPPMPVARRVTSAMPALRATDDRIALGLPFAVAQRSPRQDGAARRARPAPRWRGRRPIAAACACGFVPRSACASSRLAAGRTPRRAQRRPASQRHGSLRDERDARFLPTTRASCASSTGNAASMRASGGAARAACRAASASSGGNAPRASNALVANALPSARRTKPPDAPDRYQRHAPAGGFRRDGRLCDHAIEGFGERRDDRARDDRDVDTVRRAPRCARWWPPAGPASWSSSANATACAMRSAGIGGSVR